MADVSAATKHFPTAKEGFNTTTSGAVSAAASTVGLTSVSGYADGDVVVLVIDPTDATKKQVFTGVIDVAGVQVTGVKWTEGTNQPHSAGATVVDYETATHWALYSKGLLVQHKQDGTHANTITTDTINENTADNGVTIDGLHIENGKLDTDNSVVTTNLTDNSVTPAKMLGVDIYGRTTALSGSAPAAGSGQFYLQSGSSVLNLSSGSASISFPTAFPNGILTAVACEGDNTGGGGDVKITAASASAITVTLVGGGSATVRVNWMVIGF